MPGQGGRRGTVRGGGGGGGGGGGRGGGGGAWGAGGGSGLEEGHARGPLIAGTEGGRSVGH
ncbi:hypothetical protein Q2406_03285 [Klebsiella pneumoniae]|nr:hypothetical protein [Klebsiella pneumoniae]